MGIEVEKDDQRADNILREVLESLRSLSDQGDALATALLGSLSESGVAGVPVNQSEAEKLYRRSLAEGNDYAMVNLARILLRGNESGVREAEVLYRHAAQNGSSSAINWLIQNALNEKGQWKEGEPTDERISDLNVLAQLGDGYALYKLYRLSRGFPEKYKDLPRAFKILETLRKNGKNYDGLFAYHYMTGLGTSKNYQLGFKLALKSAMLGNASSCDILRIAYANGQGTPKSFVHSYAWTLLAAAKGFYKDSDEMLNRFETFLNPSQIAEAQKMAQSLEAEIESKRSHAASDSDSTDSVRKQPASSGTGFFISENGYIATNFHVISGAKKISVRTTNGEMGAVVVLADQSNDVAVLKAPVLGKPLTIGEVSYQIYG